MIGRSYEKFEILNMTLSDKVNERYSNRKISKMNYLFENEEKSLKPVSAIFYQIFIFSSNDRPSKTMKNVFYFI